MRWGKLINLFSGSEMLSDSSKDTQEVGEEAKLRTHVFWFLVHRSRNGQGGLTNPWEVDPRSRSSPPSLLVPPLWLNAFGCGCVYSSRATLFSANIPRKGLILKYYPLTEIT